MKYTIHKYHDWHKTFVYYPLRYRVYITLLVLLSTVSLWQMLLYRPLRRSINYYCKKNVVLSKQIQEIEKAQEQSAALLKSIKVFEQDLGESKVNSVDSNEFVAYVVKEAMKANLTMATCVAEPASDHVWYQLQSMRIDVQGNLSEIAQWLKIITDKSRLVSMPSVSITQIDQALVRCSATINCMRVRDIS